MTQNHEYSEKCKCTICEAFRQVADETPRWWVSWEQPPDKKAGWDFRPTKWPVDKRLLGYWESGFNDTHMMVCALVEAKSEKEVRTLLAAHWPEYATATERFFEEKPSNFKPSDRFQ